MRTLQGACDALLPRIVDQDKSSGKLREIFADSSYFLLSIGAKTAASLLTLKVVLQSRRAAIPVDVLVAGDGKATIVNAHSHLQWRRSIMGVVKHHLL